MPESVSDSTSNDWAIRIIQLPTCGCPARRRTAGSSGPSAGEGLGSEPPQTAARGSGRAGPTRGPGLPGTPRFYGRAARDDRGFHARSCARVPTDKNPAMTDDHPDVTLTHERR